MERQIEKTIRINARPAIVWSALTNVEYMKQWMGEPEMTLEVRTDWKVGGPIIITGFHHVRFENKGDILQFEPQKVLRYDYVSSVSQLPDTTENRTIVEFRLVPHQNQTSLILVLSNFPTESIYRHVDFYWNTTIKLLKKWIDTEL